MAWHRSWKADIGLRLSGLILGGVAYLALARLFAMPLPPRAGGALAYGLATTGFLCASAGSALAMLGAHLFDPVEISVRWQGAAGPRARLEGRLSLARRPTPSEAHDDA